MNRKIIREYEPSETTTESAYSNSEPKYIPAGVSHHSSSNRAKPKTFGSLATPQSRLIAFVIDVAVFAIGLGIIWIIWFITLAEKGTTPGHYLMGQVVVDAKTGRLLGWKKMVVREILIKGLLQWLLGSVLFMANYIVDASFIFTSRQRTLHDLVIGSQVIQCSDKTIIRKLKIDEIDGWLNK